MNVERLIRLAELLEADAANEKGVKFALDVWASDARLQDEEAISLMDYDELKKFHYTKDTKHIPVDCNTAACAMGLAAISGAFAADGLTWTLNGGECKMLVPKIGAAENFGAAEVLFNIDDVTAKQLFDPSYYEVTKGAEAELAVANRIRALVNGTWTPVRDDDDDDDDEFDYVDSDD